MTRQDSYGQKRARGRQGLLPPNPKQWENENNALDLRDQLGLSMDARLVVRDAYAILPDVTVRPHNRLPAADVFIERLCSGTGQRWGGFALPMGELGTFVVYNASHPITRARSTLMEEFFHLRLEHQPSTIRVYTGGEEWRTREAHVEDEAFGSGAAALVPYRGLKSMLETGDSVREIADRFQTSEELVRFRAKVCKLYRLLK
jgi:uncharacterized protein DUF955